MNRGIIITILVILVLVGGGLFFVSQQSPKEDDSQISQQKEESIGSEASDPQKFNEQSSTTSDESSSRYIVYSKQAFDASSSNRRVLYFYANWCPTCKIAQVDFTNNSDKIPGDVTILRINYNDPDTDQEEKDLARKYAVTYQHTFVQIDAQGIELTKWNGGKMEELLSKIK